MSNTETKMTGTISAILPTESISEGKYNKQVFAITNNTGYEGKEVTFAFRALYIYKYTVKRVITTTSI